MTDTADDDGSSKGSGAPRVPAPPSVMPGSAPSAGDHPRTPSGRGCLLVLVAVAVLGLIGMGVLVAVWRAWGRDDSAERERERQEVVDETGIETGSTDVVHPPQRDIRLGACEFDDAGGVRASGTLTNWTDEPSDYRISLSFRDGGGGDDGTEFGATVVEVQGVEPHLTTNWAGSVPVRPQGTYTCRVVRIDRWTVGEEPPSTGT